MPFAETTIKMTGDTRYSLARYIPLYLKPHLNGPAVKRFEELGKDEYELIRAIVVYSVDVVTLGDSFMEPDERARAFSEIFLLLSNLPLEEGWAGYNRTVEEIKLLAVEASRQENLLDALKVVQPVINDLAEAGELLTERSEEALMKAVQEVENEIDETHAEEIVFHKELKEQQLELLRQEKLIRKYRLGNTETLDMLLQQRPEIAAFIKNHPPSAEELWNIEKYLLDRFRTYNEMKNELEPNLELYYNKLKELNDAEQFVRDGIRRIRIALIAWVQVHSRLASGITDPAKISLTSIANGLSRSVRF
jgi:hypothetical protein